MGSLLNSYLTGISRKVLGQVKKKKSSLDHKDRESWPLDQSVNAQATARFAGSEPLECAGLGLLPEGAQAAANSLCCSRSSLPSFCTGTWGLLQASCAWGQRAPPDLLGTTGHWLCTDTNSNRPTPSVRSVAQSGGIGPHPRPGVMSPGPGSRLGAGTLSY